MQAEQSRISNQEESLVKHTLGGEMPDSSMGSEMGRRLEADLPLLSDPTVIRNIAVFFGALTVGVGLGIYFFRRSR